jgi:hypothetical protein
MTIYQISNDKDFFSEFVKQYLANHPQKEIKSLKNIIICPNNQTREEIHHRLIMSSDGIVPLPQIFTLYDINDEFLIGLVAKYCPDLLEIFSNKVASELETSCFLYNFLMRNLNSETDRKSIKQIMKDFSYANNKLCKNLINNFAEQVDKNYLLANMPLANIKMIELFILYLQEWQDYQKQKKIIDIMSFNIEKIFMLCQVANNNLFQNKIYYIANFTEDIISLEIIRVLATASNCDIFISQLYNNILSHYSSFLSKTLQTNPLLSENKRDSLLKRIFSNNLSPLSLEQKQEFNNINIIEPENDLDETNIVIKILAQKLQENPELNINIITANTIQGIALVESLEKYNIFPQHGFKKTITLSTKFSFIKLIFSLFVCGHFKQDKIYELLVSSYANFNQLEQNFINKKGVNIKKFLPARKIYNLDSFVDFLNSIAPEKLEMFEIIKEIVSSINFFILSSVVKSLIEIVEILNNGARQNIWSNDDGASLSKKLFEIINSNIKSPNYSPDKFNKDELLNFFELLTEDALFSNKQDKIHHNISILSPMEARMKKADLLIILGFTDDNWPNQNKDSHILPPQIYSGLGLKPIELAIEVQKYYLLCQLFSGRVLLSCPKKSGRQSTTASRWLTRFKLFAKISDKDLNEDSLVDEYRDFFIFSPESINDLVYNPELERRPNIMSATDLENYIASPGHFYYQKILKLKDYSDVKNEIEKRELGNLVHKIISNITIKSEEAIDKELKKITPDLNEQKVIWSQIHRIIDWALVYLHSNSDHQFISEEQFILPFEIDNNLYKIIVRPDLIEIKHGKAKIFDFKTGKAPGVKEVIDIKSLQLQLGAMAALSFSSNIESLHFISAPKGINPIVNCQIDLVDQENLLQDTKNKIIEIIKQIKAEPFAVKDSDKLYGGYKHLSRIE